jgi:acetyl-CoA carboxylase biotin carboxyl carrier protein
MKAKEIRDLIDFISNSDLDEVNIETQEFKIAVKKNLPVVNTSVDPAQAVPQSAPAQAVPEPPRPQQVSESASPPSAPVESNNYVEIKSPMIGTYYASSTPESDPFIKVGDTVKVGQTVCIVEAMKLFNEIESEYSGKVVKVLVENASPVEYDQPLFLVDPS